MIYKLSKEARGDVLDIYEYSAKRWGDAKASDYLNKLEGAFVTLAANPRIGREKGGFRYFLIASHVVFYRIDEHALTVLRLIHTQSPLTQSFISGA